MRVDVLTEIDIACPRSTVAAYAADPETAPEWYANIESVEWKTAKPLQVGSQVGFVARFMGRRLTYTYEIRELIDGERLVMSTADGQFAMETTYEWQDAPGVGTRMTLRNRGAPSGFSNVMAPAMTGAMRRANQKDLARIKEILESAVGPQSLRLRGSRTSGGEGGI